MSRRVVTVILAAGAGSRMGGPKALLVWPATAAARPRGPAAKSAGAERPLAIAHAEERLAAESQHALIVTKKALFGALLARVRPGIDLLISNAPDSLGPAGSLAFAASRLPETDYVLVTPVDLPPANPDTVERLLARLDADPALLAARPSYKGRAGHPVALRPAALDRYKEPNPPPLRDYLKELGDRCVEEEVTDASVLLDLNTPADAAAVLGALPRFFPT